jgi:dTDP-4-amino-4,6-dideoxygalactose transaminase
MPPRDVPAELVPFNRPSLAGDEFANMSAALEGMHISGDGAFSRACHAELERLLGCPRALLTTSCTHALEMAALLLDVGPDDEVIVPSFTFVSTANAFALRGAKIVFADVRPDTLNIDEAALPGLITDRTRAVAVVHYAGIGCEMDPIAAACDGRGVPIVEDNAHGLFGSYRGRALGTFGRLATLSFHETKNITCGEGGALLVNDPSLVARAEIIREKGTDRARFFRGEVDKYTWADLGSSYLPSDLLAAFLLAQLRGADTIQSLRRGVWTRYHDGLADWAQNTGARRPVVPDHCGPAYHLYNLLLPSNRARDGLIGHLRDRGIHAVFHYVPLHRSPMGLRVAARPGECPVSDDVSGRLVRLPFFNRLSADDQDRVIDAVRAFAP